VLAHELAHIRRADYAVNLLQTLVEGLLFYHPAVWWVSKRDSRRARKLLR
jgi:beta-lactamase regulating signal transducer with metallopeptidase domain